MYFKDSFFGFQDENRYSAGRGGHVNLKRAERARVTINKIPGTFHHLHLVECLISTKEPSLIPLLVVFLQQWLTILSRKL